MLQYLIVCRWCSWPDWWIPLQAAAGLLLCRISHCRGARHVALGTNKLSSAMGTTVSTARLAKHGFLKGKVLMAVCSSAAALMGSALGAIWPSWCRNPSSST